MPGANAYLYDASGNTLYDGNDYFFARYYTSALGRFTTPDWSAKVVPVPYAQMGDPQSLNLYAYVRNNPLIHVDADGHKCGEPGQPPCTPPPPPPPAPPATPGPGQDKPQLPQPASPQQTNKESIAKENSAFNKCVNDGMTKAIVKGTADAVQDNKPSEKDAETPKAAAEKPIVAQTVVPITAAVVDLHSECLTDHPLAALDSSYKGKVLPGDIGRVPEWLDFVSKLF